VRRRPTLGHLERLERTQWCSTDELCVLQDAELEKLLEHAWPTCRTIAAASKKQGSNRGDVANAAGDLPKLPLLTREEASASFEDRKSTATPLPDIGKMTSGTTGNPLAFAYRASEYWRQAMKLRLWLGELPARAIGACTSGLACLGAAPPLGENKIGTGSSHSTRAALRRLCRPFQRSSKRRHQDSHSLSVRGRVLRASGVAALALHRRDEESGLEGHCRNFRGRAAIPGRSGRHRSWRSARGFRNIRTAR
jgi:hypothetical protein